MPNQAPALSFDAIATPSSIVRQLETRSLDELAGMYRRAEVAGLRAWMLAALVVGVALERAKYGDDAAGDLAVKFGTSKRTIERLATIFRHLLRPRLETLGSRAEFPLEHAHFYTVSIQAADTVGKKPLVLLEQAETRRQRDPRYTAAKFRRDLLGDDASADGKRFVRLLRRLAKANPEAVAEIDRGHAAEVATLLDTATEKLADARRSLRSA